MSATSTFTANVHGVNVIPSSAAIDKLSSDLLGYVFALCASETWVRQEHSKIHSLHTLKDLTLVSRFWSDICHEATGMWSYIDINANESSRYPNAALSRHLTLTGSNSLSLRFTFDDASHDCPTTGQLAELFALVRSAIPRVVDLDLRLSMHGAASERESSNLFDPSSLPMNAPHLKRARVDFGHHFILNKAALFHAPALQHLTTINAGVGTYVTAQGCLERLEIVASESSVSRAFASLSLLRVVELISSFSAVTIKIEARRVVGYATDVLNRASGLISLAHTQIMELVGSSTWITEVLDVFYFPNLKSLSILIVDLRQPRSIIDLLGPKPPFPELRRLKIGRSCFLTPDCAQTLSHFTHLASLEANVRSNLWNKNDPRTSQDLTGFLRALEISDSTDQYCPSLRDILLDVRDWDAQSLSALADCLESRLRLGTSLRFLCLYLPRQGVLSTRRIDELMLIRSAIIVDPENPWSLVRHEWETPPEPELELYGQTVASKPPVSKIAFLPAELLAEIFMCLSFSLWKGGSMKVLNRVLGVCQTWDDIAKCTPKMWSFIDLFGASNAASAATRITKHVALSAELPVSLRLPLDTQMSSSGKDALQSMIQHVRQSIFPRLEELCLRIESPALLHVLLPSRAHQEAPLLQVVWIENMANLPAHLTNSNHWPLITPKLRRLTYDGTPIPALVNGYDLLERLDIRTRVISIMYSTFNVGDLLETLSSAPAIYVGLDLAHIHGSHSNKRHELHSLAHLEVIDSTNTAWLPAVLSVTHLPALETLSIILVRNDSIGDVLSLATIFSQKPSFPLLRSLTIEGCKLSSACAEVLSQFVPLETLELAMRRETSEDISSLTSFFRRLTPMTEQEGSDDHPCPRLRGIALDVRNWDTPSFSAFSDFVAFRVESGSELESVRLLLPPLHTFSTAKMDEISGSHTVQATDAENRWSWSMHEWKFDSSRR